MRPQLVRAVCSVPARVPQKAQNLLLAVPIGRERTGSRGRVALTSAALGGSIPSIRPTTPKTRTPADP